MVKEARSGDGQEGGAARIALGATRGQNSCRHLDEDRQSDLRPGRGRTHIIASESGTSCLWISCG